MSGNTDNYGCTRRVRTRSGFGWTVRLDGAVVDTSVENVIERHLELTDVTERRQAEAQKKAMKENCTIAQKMDAIDQLASGVAHEFNNLLFGIRGNAELLIHTADDRRSTQDRRAVMAIEQAGARAHCLTNQLLSFAENIKYHSV